MSRRSHSSAAPKTPPRLTSTETRWDSRKLQGEEKNESMESVDTLDFMVIHALSSDKLVPHDEARNASCAALAPHSARECALTATC